MYLSTLVRCFGNGGANMFVLTYSHPCFKVGLPPSVSFRKKQYRVCYWSKMMIKGAVCRTKNRPAIQLCYPAVNCSRQVVSSFLPGRLGQVQYPTGSLSKVRPRLHGIGSKRDRIHLDPIHFLRGVYTGSDPELLTFTRDWIHLDFMNS